MSYKNEGVRLPGSGLAMKSNALFKEKEHRWGENCCYIKNRFIDIGRRVLITELNNETETGTKLSSETETELNIETVTETN